jgi:hypothetical protein
MIAWVAYHPIPFERWSPPGRVRVWMRPSVLVALAVTALACAALTASGEDPAFPREAPGACPFECCQYGRWTGRAATVARLRPDRRSAEVFRVVLGEPVDALTGVIVTLNPGHARATTTLQLEGVTVAAGQEVLVLRPLGEGVFKIWLSGRVFEAQLLAAEESSLRLLSEPRMVWWVQIRNGHGRIGWTDQADRFDGTDACG